MPDGTSTPDVAAQQIRFALSQLRARNAHHQFEDVCRQVSLARISRNILPATGPVAAGGDQGRDFETFRSYIKDSINNSFVAIENDKSIVFACTLQIEDADRNQTIDGKIKSDVTKIVAGGPVDSIYMFCEIDMPVARRHSLQKWGRDERSVGLEIVDGHGLAELLAAPDLFWIAERYLALPAELRPSRPDTPGTRAWYAADRKRWASREPQLTIGDFVDLKDCLRHATFNPAVREDLPFWLERIRAFLGSEDKRLVQRARYEIAVATLRGLGSLVPADDLARTYLDEVIPSDDLVMLDDGAVLLMYVVAARIRSATRIEPAQMATWQRTLGERLRDLAADTEEPVSRAQLFSTLGFLYLQPDASSDQGVLHPSARAAQGSWDVSQRVTPDGELRADVQGTPRDNIKSLDAEGAIAAWTEMITLLPQAPLLPIESLSNAVAVMSPLMVDLPGWRQVVDGIDEHVVKISGRAVVAGKAYQRALALRQAGRDVAALDEVHKARVDWFTGDTLRDSLRALALTSSCYLDLRLPHAARYYALALAWHAGTSDDEDVLDLVPIGMALAAKADYERGAWLTATRTFTSAINVHLNLAENPLALREHEAVALAIKHQARIRILAQQLLPAAIPLLSEDASRVGIEHTISDLMKDIESDYQNNDRNLFDDVTAGLIDSPFVDAGPEWRAQFAALGLTFDLHCANDTMTVAAAERLCAVLQIVLVALSADDLCFTPSVIDVEVTAITHLKSSSYTQPPVPEPLPSNEGRRWAVRLSGVTDPSSAPDAPLLDEALGAVIVMLIEASMLPPQKVVEAVQAAYRNELIVKINVAPVYDSLCMLVDGPDEHARSLDATKRCVSPRAANELGERRGFGPGYTSEQAETMLRNRYENLPKMVQHTLPRLRRHPPFVQMVRDLRASGWRDWHLLTAISNVVVNERMEAARKSGKSHDQIAADVRALVGEPESKTASVVPSNRFTKSTLEQARRIAMLSLAAHWGLDARINGPLT